MANKLNLDIQTILNKQFNVDFKGYSPNEVDSFLDQVMEDYETYQSIAQQLKDRVVELENANTALRAELMDARSKVKSLEENENSNVSNVDILKRISRLEQEVFKKR